MSTFQLFSAAVVSGCAEVRARLSQIYPEEFPLKPALGAPEAAEFGAPAQCTLPLEQVSNRVASPRLLDPQAETFVPTGAGAWASGPDSLGSTGGGRLRWEAQRAEPEGMVPSMRPSPAPARLVHHSSCKSQTRQGVERTGGTREGARRMGLESAAARLPLALFSLSGAAPRPPGERSAEHPTSTSLLMSASAAASE